MINLEVDKGIPIPKPNWGRKDPLKKFHNKLAVMNNTVKLLKSHGLTIVPTREDLEAASVLVSAYAKDPMMVATNASKIKELTTYTPASLQVAKKMLDDFGHSIVEDSVRIRDMVTNKLILETENEDPRVRIKALEL